MFPPHENAPDELLGLAGPCGPISVWMVLARSNIKVEPKEIIEVTRYTPQYGCFASCMAAALKHWGMTVRLHGDPDTHPNAIELECYGQIDAYPRITLSGLLKEIAAGGSVIVSYLADGGEGHFSPLAGVRRNKVLLPYSVEGTMLKSEFEKRWRAEEILRQSIVAT